jgi:hypothetical protein
VPLTVQDREQWLQRNEARIREEMRAEKEQRRAKDAEFDYLRLLRAGSCTDNAVLSPLKYSAFDDGAVLYGSSVLF